MQTYGNINDAMNFHEAQKCVNGPSRLSLHPVRCVDGVLITNKKLILARWAEYLQNKLHSTDPGFMDDLPTLPIIPKVDGPPSVEEVVKAILSLKNNKTAGSNSIPAKVIKYGG